MERYLKPYRQRRPAEWSSTERVRRSSEDYIAAMSYAAHSVMGEFLNAAGWHLARLGERGALELLVARVRWPAPVIHWDRAVTRVTKKRGEFLDGRQPWRVYMHLEVDDPALMLSHFTPTAHALRVRADEKTFEAEFLVVTNSKKEADALASEWTHAFQTALTKLPWLLARFHRSIPQMATRCFKFYKEFRQEDWFVEP